MVDSDLNIEYCCAGRSVGGSGHKQSLNKTCPLEISDILHNNARNTPESARRNKACLNKAEAKTLGTGKDLTKPEQGTEKAQQRTERVQRDSGRPEQGAARTERRSECEIPQQCKVTSIQQSPAKPKQSQAKAKQSPAKAKQSPTKAKPSPAKAKQSPAKVQQQPSAEMSNKAAAMASSSSAGALLSSDKERIMKSDLTV